MEYSQDRLKRKIEELEADVSCMRKVIDSYRDLDRSRAGGEIAIFVVGTLLGIAIGFYVA